MDDHRSTIMEEQNKRIKDYQRQIGWQQRRICELAKQNLAMFDSLRELMEQINDDDVTAMFHIDLQNKANAAIALVEGE